MPLEKPLSRTEVSQPTDRDTWQTYIATKRGVGDVALSNLLPPIDVVGLEDKFVAYEAAQNVLLTHSLSRDEVAPLVMQLEDLEAPVLETQKTFFDNPFLAEKDDDLPKLDEKRRIILENPWLQDLLKARDLSSPHIQLVESWPKFVETYSAGIENGIQLGYIPSSVKKHLEAAIAKTSVRIIDGAILDTHGPMTAYYRNELDEIGLRHNAISNDKSIRDNLSHEFTHKLSGGSFIGIGQPFNGVIRTRIGFSTELKSELLTQTGLNEAVTQHITLGVLTGDFETIDPSKRADGDRTYACERKILAEFIDRSQGIIDIQTVTNAFFEDTGPEGQTAHRREFVRQIRQAFGPGALRKLDELMELASTIDEAQLEEIVLNRIHGPIVSTEGQIVSTGKLDTDSMPSLYDLYKQV